MSDLFSISGTLNTIYPERKEPAPDKIERFWAAAGKIFVSRFRPRWKRFEWIVSAAGRHEAAMGRWSDQRLREEVLSLRSRLRGDGYTKEHVAFSFAAIREITRRVAGIRHYDVQLIGGCVMFNGMVAEMETGEGKTLTATLPAFTAALSGVPVHIITVNDYLARRDADWMRPIYEWAGLSVGTIIHGMPPSARQTAYRSDVTYCTNKELTFDYLRDRIVLWDKPTSVHLRLERLYGEKSRINRLLLRGLHFAIVDEADSVLIDESRTPLIISSEAAGAYDPRIYRSAMDAAKELDPKLDCCVFPEQRLVELTDRGKEKVGKREWESCFDQINEEQRQELVRKALSARHLFEKDIHYLVKDGKVQIIDEFTGRLMADRSWEQGLHQLIEIKEGCEPTLRKETRARISYQRFFRRYLRLSGMTGTGREVSGELWSVYGLRVVTIPPNRPEQRRILPDRVYGSKDRKYESVVQALYNIHRAGRPVLVGTRSVEASERLSLLLKEANLEHRVLNARQDQEEAEIVSDAGLPGRITVATNMAGRGTDIRLGPGVAEMGGLHVIATERHEARRIDRQLFGRCGRQGDPGTCQAMVSLEDELITMHVSKLLRVPAFFLLRRPEGFFCRIAGLVLFRLAQGMAERLHARMRADLQRMDEQLGQSLAFAGQAE